ncbi:hypothetical protein Unana1_05487 [Umbelopsis nana]
MIFKTVFRFRCVLDFATKYFFKNDCSIVLTYEFDALEPRTPYQDMLNIDDYYITYNNAKDNAGMEVLCDDETLKDALQNLGENERLEIKLCPKQLHKSPNSHRYRTSPNAATQPLRYFQRDDFKTSPRMPALPKSSSVRCDDLSLPHDMKHHPAAMLPAIGPTQPLSAERRHSVVDHRVTQFSTSPPISAERRHSIADTSNIPVIKPTVVRWIVRRDSEPCPIQPPSKYQAIDMAACMKRNIHRESMAEDIDRIVSRKDSAVDLEPTRKKLKVMASDQSLARCRSSLPLKSPDMESAVIANTGSPTGQEYQHPLQPFHWNNREDDQQRPLHMRPLPPKLLLSNSNRPSPFTITLPGITSLTEETDQTVSPLLAPINSMSPGRKIGPPTPSTSGSESTSSSTATSPTMSLTRHSSQKRATRSDKGGHHQRRIGNPEYGGDFLCQEIVDQSTGRICGQTFRRSYDLSRHQTIHLKNRPFCYCTHCGKKFTRMDALRRHERVQGHSNSRNSSSGEMTKHIAAN